MKAFVRSSGVSQECGYCWVPKEPEQWSQISNLIESSSPSVVLTRSNNQLSLFVTGISSSDRRDFRDRTIRHCLAWVCSDNTNCEKRIRTIAIQALRGSLGRQVDQYITLVDNKAGFQVDFLGIENLAQIDVSLGSSDLPDAEYSPKIAKNFQELKDDIANKLQHYNLPKSYEFVIIVTGIKAEKILEKVGAWRSLSSMVKSDDWRDLVTSSDGDEATSRNFRRAVVIILLVITAILVLLLILNFLT